MEKSERRHVNLAWALVALTIGLRVYHYLCNAPVWCDELWLLRNIVGKTFFEQLGPLSDVQAAPPLFLWAERVIWIILGPSTYAMRLLPLLAGCGTMLMLVPLGRLCLRASALPWAVLLLGCSDAILRYTCDVKPYTTDSFLAVAIPLLFCGTQGWSFGQRLALFTFLAPLVIFLSYPGCFIIGALALAFLPGLWSFRHQWQAWLSYGLFILIICAAFVLLVTGPIRAQHTPALDACWTDYPDWQHPWTVPQWSLEAILKLLEHMWRPTGALLIVPAIVGIFSMWRRNKRAELLLLGLPGSLAMLAAWAHSYPFESRVVLYIVAPLSFFIGEGVIVIIQWLRCRFEQPDPVNYPRLRMTMTACIVVIYFILLVPLIRTFYHVAVPAPRLTQEQWPETKIVPVMATEPSDTH